VLGISGGDPAFRHDDGSARPEVVRVLTAFAAGEASEHAVLVVLATSRLLVPVVAVPAEDEPESGPAESGQPSSGPHDSGQPGHGRDRGEKASDMAMPTLIGLDGRRAIPAFTALETLIRWQPEARPVPVAAAAVWQAACADDAAVVIDVAGPVPFAVEGARLAALAKGEEPPPPFADPDVREIVAAALAHQLDVASFELEPGGDDHDLAIVLTLTGERATSRAGTSRTGTRWAGTDQRGHDAAQLGAELADAVMARLGGRLKRGVAIWLGE
jgi:hypothetical protein